MSHLGLKSRLRRRYRIATTASNHTNPIAENLLDRVLVQQKPPTRRTRRLNHRRIFRKTKRKKQFNKLSQPFVRIKLGIPWQTSKVHSLDGWVAILKHLRITTKLFLGLIPYSSYKVRALILGREFKRLIVRVVWG